MKEDEEEEVEEEVEEEKEEERKRRTGREDVELQSPRKRGKREGNGRAGGVTRREREAAIPLPGASSERERGRGAHSSSIPIQHDLEQLAEAPHDGPSDQK